MGKVGRLPTKRLRFTFRPNPEQANHRQAWEILQAVPDGQKTAYLVETILQLQKQQQLEELLRRVIREEIKNCAVQRESPAAPKQEIPPEMLGFLNVLTAEDD